MDGKGQIAVAKTKNARAKPNMPAPEDRILPQSDLPDTVVAALEAALRIVISSGYAQLTMRAVAEEASVSLGTLTYHFPDKQTLIAKALEVFVDGVLTALAELARSSGLDPVAELESLIRQHAETTLAPAPRAFDFELWAYSEHDPQARRLLEQLQRRLLETYSTLIRAACPSVDHAGAERRAALLVSMIEGMTFFFPPGGGHASHTDLTHLKEDICAQARRIALGEA